MDFEIKQNKYDRGGSRIYAEKDGNRKRSAGPAGSTATLSEADMEKHIKGECGTCGNPVVKIIDSRISCRSDGLRFATPEMLADHEGWEMFRCRKCLSVIEKSWRPIGETINVNGWMWKPAKTML